MELPTPNDGQLLDPAPAGTWLERRSTPEELAEAFSIRVDDSEPWTLPGLSYYAKRCCATRSLLYSMAMSDRHRTALRFQWLALVVTPVRAMRNLLVSL
jgi:hypothetical protein